MSGDSLFTLPPQPLKRPIVRQTRLRVKLKRSETPPPELPEIWKMIEVAKSGYATLYGNKRAGILRRAWWGTRNYILEVCCWGLGARVSEICRFRPRHFDFETFHYLVEEAATKSGKPKGGHERLLRMNPTVARLLEDAFKEMSYKPDDYIISGRRDRMGNPIPTDPRNAEYTLKDIALASGVDPERVWPHLGRVFIGTTVGDATSDAMAGDVLGHLTKDKGRIVRESYRKHTADQQLAAATKALDPVFKPLLPKASEEQTPPSAEKHTLVTGKTEPGITASLPPPPPEEQPPKTE